MFYLYKYNTMYLKKKKKFIWACIAWSKNMKKFTMKDDKQTVERR
jgi:hypothetical protein